MRHSHHLQGSQPINYPTQNFPFSEKEKQAKLVPKEIADGFTKSCSNFLPNSKHKLLLNICSPHQASGDMKIKKFNLVLKKLMMWPERWMAQQMRALAAFPENCEVYLQGSNTPFWLPRALITCAHVYTETHTHTHKKNFLKM